jgi:hypothetical protein
MTDINQLAFAAIERAKNLQEFVVFRDMNDIVFSGDPIPYSIRHHMGELAEIAVPAVSQAEAEQRVNEWLEGQRA